VKAFLKAGILTELGDRQDTHTGTPQGGILSPLLANIALSVLDEHLTAPWKPGGTMPTSGRRNYRRSRGLPTWRLVRYADDFVVLVHGTQDHTAALREDVAAVLAPLGLRLSPAKTRIVHLSDGFDFLGFHIQWQRKRGSNRWHVYTFIAARPIRSLKAKIRALTRRTSQQDLRSVRDQAQPGHARLGQLLPARRRQAHLPHPGPVRLATADHDAHAPAPLELEDRPQAVHHADRQVAARHRGRDRAPADSGHPGDPLPVTRDPQSLAYARQRLTTATVESPLRGDAHGGFGERPGETDQRQHGNALQADSTSDYRTSVRTGRLPTSPRNILTQGSGQAGSSASACIVRPLAAARPKTRLSMAGCSPG
jgi:hypothetical protein